MPSLAATHPIVVHFAIALAELAILVLARRGLERVAVIASAVLGLPAVFCLYEAGEHGGDLVYSYAGGDGPGTRPPSSPRSRFASDPNVQTMAAESALVDRKDPADALEAAGRADAARATLQQLASAFSDNRRIKQRLAGSPSPAPAR